MRFLLFWLSVSLAISAHANTGIAQISAADSVVKPASTRYSNSSFLGRFLTGTNYREVWSIPVSMPVFDLSKQGFTIAELGGGQQTKSLRLLDKNKKEWVLRTVDKEAEGAVPEKFRIPLVVNFVQDMISASHPYGALVVSELALANNIIAPRPKLYFVPDDENFGPYRELFANVICFLEQREPTPDNSGTESTSKVMEEIIEENDHLVLQKAVLNARLLDMLIGDWDRHADQWRWGQVASNGHKYYYAIPRDRDQAFFWANGFVPRFIRLFGLKHVNGFRKKSKGLKNLNFKSWRFDKTFLNELDAAIWDSTIRAFQYKLSDQVIKTAVKKLPKEAYVINGPSLEARLTSRRNTLLENAMKYYRFIANTVDVSGTEDQELFEIKQTGKKLNVAIYRMKGKKRGEKIYDRSFDSKETRFINLDGLGGNDVFVVEKNVSSKIKLKINGGEGKDAYDLNGKMKTVVYDSALDKNNIANQSNAKIYLN